MSSVISYCIQNETSYYQYLLCLIYRLYGSYSCKIHFCWSLQSHVCIDAIFKGSDFWPFCWIMGSVHWRPLSNLSADGLPFHFRSTFLHHAEVWFLSNNCSHVYLYVLNLIIILKETFPVILIKFLLFKLKAVTLFILRWSVTLGRRADGARLSYCSD